MTKKQVYLTKREIESCCAAWKDDENLTLFQLISKKTVEKMESLGYRLPSPIPENIREEIARIIDFVCEGQCDTCTYFHGETDGEIICLLPPCKTDYILSLIKPLIEQAREEGSKEVLKWITEHSTFIAGADIVTCAGHEMKQDISYYPVIKWLDWQVFSKEV